MTVDARPFRLWVQQAGLPTGVSELARGLGLGRSTLQAQILRGRITEETVVLAARLAKANPVEVLSTFDQYRELEAQIMPPTTAEVLSQTTYIDISVEVTERLGGVMAGTRDHYIEPSLPTVDGVRSWLNTVDPGEIRRTMAAEFKISSQNISTLLAQNRLRPDLAIYASKVAGVSSTSGLVVTGLITPEEGGWPHRARTLTLAGLTESELIGQLIARGQFASRVLGQALEEHAKAQKFRSTLG